MAKGHIRARGPGAWELKYDIGVDPVTGRRIREAGEALLASSGVAGSALLLSPDRQGLVVSGRSDTG